MASETSMDARVALALFLRREQRFQDALTVVRGLTVSHPPNDLFPLEEEIPGGHCGQRQFAQR